MLERSKIDGAPNLRERGRAFNAIAANTTPTTINAIGNYRGQCGSKHRDQSFMP